jgi:hypothetical protein
MHAGLTISVVIPAYNEERGIGTVLEALPDCVDEVVVVDNNSKDHTADVARSLGAKTVLEQRQGYGWALRRGFAEATKDVVVSMDADGTYPSEQIADVIDVLQRENLDFISCSRFPLVKADAMSSRNVFGNKMLTLIFGLLFWHWLKDSQSGMWVFRRRILPLMHFEGQTWEFSSEIKIEACTNPRIRFREVHIAYHPRIGFSHFHTWQKAIAVGVLDIRFLVAQRFVCRRERQHQAYAQARRAEELTQGPLGV